MKEQELWDVTIQTLETFYATLPHERTISAEETAEHLLKAHGAVSPQERVFARECAAGLVRFEKLCDGVFKGYSRYCHRHKKTDRLSMLLMAYIVIFRYRELGGHKVRELFLNCTDITCILEYVGYILNLEALVATAMPFWLQSYDNGFLETVVLKNLRDIRAEAHRDVVEWYRVRCELSVISPHIITEPCPEPGEHPHQGSSGKSPSPDDPRSIRTSALRSVSAKEKGDQSIMEKRVYTEDHKLKLPPKDVREMVHTVPEPRPVPIPVLPPPLPLPRKPLTQPIGFEFLSRPNQESKYHASPPLEDQARLEGSPEIHSFVPPKAVEPARYTTAALLKEAHAHKSRKQNELKVLKEKEACPLDSADYDKWRAEESVKDEQKREMDILQRHLDAIRTEESVRQKRIEQKELRLKETKELREEKRLERERKARQSQRQLEVQKGHVQSMREQIAAGRQQAVEKIVAKKNEEVKDIQAEVLRGKAEGRAKEEALQAERLVVIRDIKQLRERIKRKRVEFAEANRNVAWEAPKTREVFLDSMSIMELRDELCQTRERFREDEEARRRLIVQEREKAKHTRQELERLCEAERSKVRNSRVAARAAVKASREAVKAARQAVESDHMLALHEKLEAKREQQRGEWTRMREMERQHTNEVLLRAEDFHGKEQRRWEQEERSHIKRVTANQADYAEGTKRGTLQKIHVAK